jgi:hypothetical protein
MQQAKYDVFGAHRVVAQSSSLSPSIFQRPLGVRAKRVRIDPGWGMRGGRLTQSGLASSISMMGMPSSTG